MNRKDLARSVRISVNELLVEPTAINQDQAAVVVDNLIDHIQAELVAGNPVKINDFGSLFTVTRKACTKSHPQNPGQMVEIPAKRVVKFKPYTDLSEAVKGVAA